MTGSKILGIVTRRDDNYVYVWCSRYQLKELKFPRWEQSYSVWFQPGDLVRVVEPDSQNIDALQSANNIEKEESRTKAFIVDRTQNNPCNWSVQAHFGFPPSYEEYCKKEINATQVFGCKAIAHSVEFGKVALFGDQAFEPSKLYIGFVTRITRDRNWIAEKLDTLWVFDENKPFEEIDDPMLLEQVRQRMPWKESYIDSVFGIPNKSTNTKGFNEGAEISENEQLIVWDESKSETNVKPSTTFDFSEIGRDPCGGRSTQNRQRVKVEELPLTDVTTSSFNVVENKITQENQLFGNLLATKLQWIHERNAPAAAFLQKNILDLCFKVTVELFSSQTQDEHTHQKSDPNWEWVRKGEK